MSIEIQLSGLLFFGIIITNVVSNRFGYQTIGDLKAVDKLRGINKDTKKFKIGFTLIVLEHICIIALATMLFIAFNQYKF